MNMAAYSPDGYEVSRMNGMRSDGVIQEFRQDDIGFASQQSGGMFAGVSPAVAREVATIQGQIMLAKLYPRDMASVWKKVEAACSRKKLAQNALYQYARGGTDISGPSIRLAEALINAYGNAKSGFEVIDSSPESSRVRAYAYDMETNTIQERTFDVEHVRSTRSGKTRLTDPRDIYETIANNASRRERACILALLPGDLVDYAVNLCTKTLEADVDITPDKIEGLLKGLSRYGVSQVMVEARIQRHISAMTASQFVTLCSIGTSLKDGVAKPEDFFDFDAKPLGNAGQQQAPATHDSKSKSNSEKQSSNPEPPDKKAASASSAPAEAKAPRKASSSPAPSPSPAPEEQMAAGSLVPDDIWGEGPESYEDDSEGFYDN